LQALKDFYDGNYRYLQDLNARQLVTNK
jgi:hypothetical protein